MTRKTNAQLQKLMDRYVGGKVRAGERRKTHTLSCTWKNLKRFGPVDLQQVKLCVQEFSSL